MANKRQIFTQEFMVEAVKLVTEQGYSIPEAAWSLGIGPFSATGKRPLKKKAFKAFLGMAIFLLWRLS